MPVIKQIELDGYEVKRTIVFDGEGQTPKISVDVQDDEIGLDVIDPSCGVGAFLTPEQALELIQALQAAYDRATGSAR